MSYIQINDSVNRNCLADDPFAGSDAGMGRPPLGMKPTTIRFSLETIQRIEKLVGNRRLAVFIREAVENELKRRENPEPPKP